MLHKIGAISKNILPIQTQLEFDLSFARYGGTSLKEYPIWHVIDLNERYTFLYNVDLVDYGYMADDELVKCTNDGSYGAIAFRLQNIDRFACRVYLRGLINASSAEMHEDVTLVLAVSGCRANRLLDYASEAIAEGHTFGLEKRHKQAFFQYFSALDSFINIQVSIHNASAPLSDQIGPRCKLSEKLKFLFKNKLAAQKKDFSAVPIWSNLFRSFKDLNDLRNKIAHNGYGVSFFISPSDADDCFTTTAIILAILQGAVLSHEGIKKFYDIL